MSQRFQFRGPYAMRVQTGSKILAYFNVVDSQTGLEYRDMRLIEGKNGVFASSPSRTYKNKEQKDAYSDYVRAAYNDDDTRDENGVAWFEEMAKAAYAFYQTQDGANAAPSAAKSAAPARRSARGPVPTVSSGSSDNSGTTGKKLPF